KLEPHVERHEVAGRNHDHHAGDGKRHDERELEPGEAAPRHVIRAHGEDGGRAEKHGHLGETREGVVHEHAAERRHRVRRRKPDPRGKAGEDRDGGPGERAGQFVLASVDRTEKRGHGVEDQDHFGKDGGEIGGEDRGSILQWLASCTPVSAGTAAWYSVTSAATEGPVTSVTRLG